MSRWRQAAAQAAAWAVTIGGAMTLAVWLCWLLGRV